ncbi:hypothetical protein RGE_29720 [Rubrivivax gelatinosus IL144]|uniref:Uncharacterized protein n=1 Tax=Rubrivivax gelatinosus (strain NBRC 100245 / IL144) TaxID=983917 RepID=I0HTH4_RUBGI|nr:hypothetical protein RGE_29720 [Rubrivivax gelatinosus IL144]
MRPGELGWDAAAGVGDAHARPLCARCDSPARRRPLMVRGACHLVEALGELNASTLATVLRLAGMPIAAGGAGEQGKGDDHA